MSSILLGKLNYSDLNNNINNVYNSNMYTNINNIEQQQIHQRTGRLLMAIGTPLQNISFYLQQRN